MTTNRQPSSPTDPACRPFAPLLPLLPAGELTAEQEAALRAHLRACAHCQRELAAYATVDAAVRRHFGALKDPLFASLEQLQQRAEARVQPPVAVAAPPAPMPAAPRSAPRLLARIGLVAAVLALILITTGLFLSRHPSAAQPAVAPPSVYIAPQDSPYTTSRELLALDASTGSVRWRYQTGPVLVAPILQAGILYIASTASSTSAGNTTLYAFRASDGHILWQRQLSGPASAMQISAGSLYVSIGQAATYAFKASSGALLWTFAQGPLIAVANGVAYISGTTMLLFQDTPLYAVDASTGRVIWQHPGNGANTFTIWQVYPADGLVYAIAGEVGSAPLPITILALDPRTGQQLWSSPLLGDIVAIEPHILIADGVGQGSALFPEGPNEIFGLNPANGAQVWHVQLPTPATYTAGALANGILYRGATNHTLVAIDTTTGSALWQQTLNIDPNVDLAAAGLLVLSTYTLTGPPTGDLEVRRAADGSLLWSHQAPDASGWVNNRALVNGIVYTDIVTTTPGAGAGTVQEHTILTALRASDGKQQWSYNLGLALDEYLTIG